MYKTRSGQITTNKHQNVNQFVGSTSDFRKIDIYSLNIVFEDVQSQKEIVHSDLTVVTDIPEEVYVSNLSSAQIRDAARNPRAILDLTRKSRTFVQLISYLMENESVVRGTEESRTDAFVQHLLEKLEFGEYPLMIQPQPIFKFKVHTKEISSKYDYAVIRDSKIMLIDEDKHFRNTGPPSAWGEYQIAGEIISGAYCNYSLDARNYKDTMYAVRVIGLRFTFYKAIVPQDYLDSLGDGLPVNEVKIYRFPPSSKDQSFPHLDYGDPEGRRTIIEILVSMRMHLTN